MMDEEEYEEVTSLLWKGVKNIKSERRHLPEADQPEFIQQQYRPAIDAYRRITGWTGPINPDHLWHHRISKFGPPCLKCGKPLRTPQAVHCAACGADRETPL
jgi:hypothetical protein